MKQRTEKRSLEKAEAAREAMASASRLVWRCDPKKHEENTTYVQLTELLQGHVQNEVDLNPHSTCREIEPRGDRRRILTLPRAANAEA